MFIKQRYYYGPSFYALDEVPKRQLRSVEQMDPWSTRQIETGKVAKHIVPHGGKKYRTISPLLENREQFVIVGVTTWTDIEPDLSVRLLENTDAKYAADMPSLSLKVLHASIEAHCATDFNPSLGRRRKETYKSLLDAYFAATTDLDILARNASECSTAVRGMMVGKAVEFANPTRELLLRMATAQLHGQFEYDKFESAINGLIESWNPAPTGSNLDKIFAIEQADQRALAFLAQQELA